ncbi:MAG TPA: ABC transporter permease [Chloroflexota bacterium]
MAFQRLVQGAIVLILVSAITFLLVNLAPGGPSSLMRMDATPEQREALTRRLGLDQPIPVRYVQWLGGALHGDLGTSLSSSEPVGFRIGQRLPNTLLLAGTSLAVSILIGIPLGVIAALRRNSLPDFLVALVSVLGLSVPAFWLGIILILMLSVNLNWLPSSGIATTGNEGDIRDRFLHLLMPAIVLSTTVLPYVVRFTRSALLDVLSQDYVRTATAKGLARVNVVYGHALRNALVPVVSIIGTLVPRLVGGSVITEAVFGWPGMGRLAVEAANGRDYPLIVGITVVVSAVVVLSSLIVDMAYTWLDPRIRLA